MTRIESEIVVAGRPIRAARELTPMPTRRRQHQSSPRRRGCRGRNSVRLPGSPPDLPGNIVRKLIAHLPQQQRTLGRRNRPDFLQAEQLVQKGGQGARFLRQLQHGRKKPGAHRVLQLREAGSKLIQNREFGVVELTQPVGRQRKPRSQAINRPRQALSMAPKSFEHWRDRFRHEIRIPVSRATRQIGNSASAPGRRMTASIFLSPRQVCKKPQLSANEFGSIGQLRLDIEIDIAPLRRIVRPGTE